MRISDWSSDVCSSDLGAAWRVLGQQVMFAPLNLAPLPDLQALNLLRLPSEGLALNPDQWAGYNANRQRVIDVLRGAHRAGRIDDVVVLTGHIPTSGADRKSVVLGKGELLSWDNGLL